MILAPSLELHLLPMLCWYQCPAGRTVAGVAGEWGAGHAGMVWAVCPQPVCCSLQRGRKGSWTGSGERCQCVGVFEVGLYLLFVFCSSNPDASVQVRSSLPVVLCLPTSVLSPWPGAVLRWWCWTRFLLREMFWSVSLLLHCLCRSWCRKAQRRCRAQCLGVEGVSISC